MNKPEREKYIEKLLRTYQARKVYLENLRRDIEDKRAELRQFPAPNVPGYSPAASSEEHSLSQEERCYFQKSDLQEEIFSLQQQINQWEPLIRRLERALEALTPTDRAIIQNRYIYGFSWGTTARAAHASESYCRTRKDKLLGLLADMVFGPNEPPVPVDLFL